MAIPYPYEFESPTNFRTASYLNQSESELFIRDSKTDFWYGYSEMDAIELTVFDLNENQLEWNTLNTEKEYKTISLTYLNEKEEIVSYSYRELKPDFIQYKNSQILISPAEQLSSSFGILEGSYTVSYNFVREMAGTPTERLVVKDISPSRKEVKLIPLRGNSLRYQAFCLKKLQVKDVAPLILHSTSQCPYDTIYNEVKNKYPAEITFLKNLWSLSTDGAFTKFLKTLYEDVVTYTNPSDSAQPLEKIKRIQGIQTYFNNYLLSNYEMISDFEEIENKFNEFTLKRIQSQFSIYGFQEGKEFVAAKKFLVDFFTEHFYWPISHQLNTTFNEKYYSHFKNALNLGDAALFLIIDHSFLDERVDSTDPLTLLIKLKDGLPDEVKKQTECWVTNISLAPYLVNINVKNPLVSRTVKISPPNFELESENVSLYNSNQTYTAEDLENEIFVQENIDIQKKVQELNVDYSSFEDFVVFSSAAMRTTLFKDKITKWTNLSASLSNLNATYSQSLVAGTPYQYFFTEKDVIESQMNEVADSFDGYESYLFQSGSHEYNLVARDWVYPQYVADRDEDAIYYDRSNRDSLINNTPDHIILDSGNSDYLTFLAMVGHYFDNLYLYITNLPSEKMVDNDPNKTFTKKIVDHMLESFGWKLDTTFEDASLEQSYLATENSVLSAEERFKAIRTRILASLPQIYKTKGSEESIRLLLTCYGIPTTLLKVREYGGIDYTRTSDIVFTKTEKTCMFTFGGKQDTSLQASFILKPKVRTTEFKLILDQYDKYPIKRKHIFHSVSNGYTYMGPLNPINPTLTGLTMGFWRERGTMGRIYAEIGSGLIPDPTKSSTIFTSSLLPLFDGEIFNIMFRRNNVDDRYEASLDEQVVPTRYDLVVQRNEYGRQIFRSETSRILYVDDNRIVDGISLNPDTSSINSGTITWGEIGTPFYGNMGNMMIWNAPISDSDFETHCNDFNSYAYSGSDAEKHLIIRLDYSEPEPFSVAIEELGLYYVKNQSEYYETSDDRFRGYTGYMQSGSITGGSFSGSFSGSASGSFVGISNGHITGSAGTFFGEYIGSWTGMLTGSHEGIITSSLLLGVFTGSISSPPSSLIISLYGLDPMPNYIWYSTSELINESSSLDLTTCKTVTQQIYPYEFTVYDLDKTFMTRNYGPNRYKNEKVKVKDQLFDTRLDAKNRSTYIVSPEIASDSNLLGLYLDPQDQENRDIIKFLGNYDIMDLIGDPANLYSSSYVDLKEVKNHYHSFGYKKPLPNELITLYKIYFNRSVFEAARNLVPARTSVRTGILIEPTVLERPKYQYRPVDPEMNTGSAAYFDVTATRYGGDPTTKVVRFSGSKDNTSDGRLDLLFGDFNLDTSLLTGFNSHSLPPRNIAEIDVGYVEDPNFIYPLNYGGAYIPDALDKLQSAYYASIGDGQTYGLPGVYGVTNKWDFVSSASTDAYFLMKKWDRYTVYNRQNPHSTVTNPNGELYMTNSVFLYQLVAVPAEFYNQIFYTSSYFEPFSSTAHPTTQPDVIVIGGNFYYNHKINTGKITPNTPLSDIQGTKDYSFGYLTAGGPFFRVGDGTYFEVFKGYPRGHYTHKGMQFSPVSYKMEFGKRQTRGVGYYVKSRQTMESTIGEDGLEDGSLPVQVIETSNVNLTQGNNVINQ